MKKASIFLVLLSIFMAFPLEAAAPAKGKKPAQTQQMSVEPLSIRTARTNYDFQVEIAQTEAEQEHGLMGRTELADNRGMLFIMPEDTDIKMWMKDTLIPLDMLFLDKTGQIVYIAANTTPNSTNVIDPGMKTRGVLEVPGGTAERLRIFVGHKVIHPAFAEKP